MVVGIFTLFVLFATTRSHSQTSLVIQTKLQYVQVFIFTKKFKSELIYRFELFFFLHKNCNFLMSLMVVITTLRYGTSLFFSDFLKSGMTYFLNCILLVCLFFNHEKIPLTDKSCDSNRTPI